MDKVDPIRGFINRPEQNCADIVPGLGLKQREEAVIFPGLEPGLRALRFTETPPHASRTLRTN